VKQFIWGMLTMACLIVTLFFLRYWRASGDRLFAFFAVAFALMSLNWFCLALIQPAFEAQHVIYLVRLVAFTLIIVGIMDKNRASR